MRSFAYAHLALPGRDLFLFLHTAHAPSPEEWAEAVTAFVACEEKNGGDVDRLGFLAVTDGGAPDARRRGEFNRFLRGRALRTAVVTDQALVRGAVSAINWFNPHIKVFSARHLREALVYLGLPEDTRQLVLDGLVGLQAGMDRVRTLAALVRAGS